ncbi:MAG: HAD hydrolase-like protein, partial [Thermoplasmata archaeon]
MPRAARPKTPPTNRETREEPTPSPELSVLPVATSAFAEVGHSVITEPDVAPRRVERGVVVFDLDGTILDDVGLISHVAADVLERAFGTPPEEGRIHYLATTGMPFEAQLAQLYPEVPADQRLGTARIFHERKVKEAYAHAALFPEIPRVLR